ncbi:unnamed protein product [Rotaria magnacalcarata]|nr:unnamed protein product [Rotaria magnacalcarata]CAF1674836.1 unnamed protein product [Rotaria magnacalcarata]CAF2128389.1 unnamed protein product [Rotaria magnacalcarata]CAF2197319.1 unnamed protein product [Rotaria magnacalcarata]CAF3739957.1 unnamed protein product [Rotaria magnacalcarata]
MSSMNDTSLPITGICLVSKPDNVPTGYECIRKVYGEPSRDADLMADSMLERKDRFLCITRIFPLAGNKAFVLEDIKIINERDIPPQNYTPLNETIDTRAKGTSKRTICVRLAERQAGMKCVCDIIFLYRHKRPPQFYTLIGDINGFQMCTKEGTVPPFRAIPPPPPPSNIYPNPTHHQSYAQTPKQNSKDDYSNIYTLGKKSEEKDILDGIPFTINPIYLTGNRNSANDLFGLDSYRILSPYDIEQYYPYDFHLERHSLSLL